MILELEIRLTIIRANLLFHQGVLYQVRSKLLALASTHELALSFNKVFEPWYT